LETEYKAFYQDELAPFLRSVSETAASKVREELEDGPEGPQRISQPGEAANVVRPRRFGSR
jgi:hypothetical protein